MSGTLSSTSLPQGFSVFQATLGAPLQFLPALGTKELDMMVEAYVPGPASLKEKRAAVSVDFFDYTQATGHSFKFYPVYGVQTTAPASPSSSLQTTASASPLASSSVSNWDWSSVAASTPADTTSKPKSSRASSKTSNRHSTADFSHIPGMKILTKDGTDVTNAASRGCKTKAQRDHAHLIRILKACDSCRRKKIRCEPSHKRRAPVSSSSLSSSPVVQKSAPRPTKNSRASQPVQHQKPATQPSQNEPAPHPESLTIGDAASQQLWSPESFDLDASLAFNDPTALDFFEPLDMQNNLNGLWDDSAYYPPDEFQELFDFFETESLGLSSAAQQSQGSPSSFSASTSASPLVSDDQLSANSVTSVAASWGQRNLPLQTISPSSVNGEAYVGGATAFTRPLASSVPGTLEPHSHALPQSGNMTVMAETEDMGNNLYGNSSIPSASSSDLSGWAGLNATLSPSESDSSTSVSSAIPQYPRGQPHGNGEGVGVGEPETSLELGLQPTPPVPLLRSPRSCEDMNPSGMSHGIGERVRRPRIPTTSPVTRSSRSADPSATKPACRFCSPGCDRQWRDAGSDLRRHGSLVIPVSRSRGPAKDALETVSPPISPIMARSSLKKSDDHWKCPSSKCHNRTIGSLTSALLSVGLKALGMHHNGVRARNKVDGLVSDLAGGLAPWVSWIPLAAMASSLVLFH